MSPACRGLFPESGAPAGGLGPLEPHSLPERWTRGSLDSRAVLEVAFLQEVGWNDASPGPKISGAPRGWSAERHRDERVRLAIVAGFPGLWPQGESAQCMDGADAAWRQKLTRIRHRLRSLRKPNLSGAVGLSENELADVRGALLSGVPSDAESQQLGPLNSGLPPGTAALRDEVVAEAARRALVKHGFPAHPTGSFRLAAIAAAWSGG